MIPAQRYAYLVPVCALAALLSTACGSSSSTSTAGSAGSGPGQGPGTVGLECKALALCSTYKVATTKGTLPARTGGTIADGTYTFVGLVAEQDVAVDSVQSAVVFASGTYRSVFALTGSSDLGTFTTSGSKLTATAAQLCSPAGEAGENESGASAVSEYRVDGDRLYLFDDTSITVGNTPVPVARVYQRFDGDLCKSPGTATCDVGTCTCASTKGATLPAASCGP